jgi:16S rRNA processing protein RimM
VSTDDLIIVGRVRKSHGVRGDLVVEPITDDPDGVFAPGRKLVAGTVTGDPAKDRRELTIASAHPFKGGFIVHFDDITDRVIADTWRDRYLLLPATELEPLGADEVYVHDLIGMRVELVSGEALGTVDGLYELPQGLTLDVLRATGGKTVLIPFDRIVTSVDRDARIIRIDPPAGLLDD